MKTTGQLGKLTMRKNESKAICNRLDTIERKLPALYRLYESSARCSQEQYNAWKAIDDLQIERRNLENVLEVILGS